MKDVPRTGRYTDKRNHDPPASKDQCPNRNAFFMQGAASEGDSGSPVLTLALGGKSKPVGILTHLVIGTDTVAGTLVDNVENVENVNVVTGGPDLTAPLG